MSAAAGSLVPPLRACDLCVHRREADGQLHCACPAVRELQGIQPVRVVRSYGEACGPEARHLHMASWGRA